MRKPEEDGRLALLALTDRPRQRSVGLVHDLVRFGLPKVLDPLKEEMKGKINTQLKGSQAFLLSLITQATVWRK